MRYKVGDKVKVRKDLKVGDVYGLWLFTEEMKDFCGKVVNITEVNKRTYCIASSNCYWTDEMFEYKDKEGQKMHKSVTIVVNENKVTAYCDGKTGVARCHPDDDFDFYIGAKLALERLEEADQPYGWLKDGMVYYTPEITGDKLYERYVYDADRWDKKYMKRGIVFKTKEEAIKCAKKMLATIESTEE